VLPDRRVSSAYVRAARRGGASGHEVLFLGPDTPAFAGRVREYLPRRFPLTVLHASEEEVFDQAALWAALPRARYLIVWTRVTRGMIEAAPGLRFIQVLGSGYEMVDVEAARERDVPIGTTLGANAISCGELVFGCVIALYRKLFASTESVKRGEWISGELRASGLVEVHGKTLGLVGFGTLGQAVARIGRGFGVRMLYHKRSRLTPAEERRWRVRYAPLDELLRQSDIVSVQVPLTPDTAPLIGRREIALMKPDALLINIARGPVIDEDALAEALDQGRIGGAGLDVFTREPVPAGSLLLKSDRVVLTPHVGGSTQEALARNMKQACDNVRRVALGAPAHHTLW
jgi:phosphoglycerate dehydrogenase-like enzyme